MSNENKNLVRRWVEERFNRHNLDVCSEVMADTYIEHAVAPFGREALVRFPNRTTCVLRLSGCSSSFLTCILRSRI